MSAPKGNQYAKGKTPTRRARSALCRVLLANKLKGVRDLDQIWAAQIEAAKNGDHQAAKLIFETMDGKPMQQTQISGPEGGPILVSASSLSDDQLASLIASAHISS